ncbi:MAG TPA: hypothetical protein ENJ82_03345, partial [Bacteroidetes bacterium]|nr:hypothetical protein [Bacteroidota bacterium]
MKEKLSINLVCQTSKAALALLFFGLLLGAGGTVLGQISVFPHLEDFESEYLCAPICRSVCPLQGTFRNVTTDDNDFISDRGGTPSGNTGPTIDHTTNSRIGNYLYVESSCNNLGFPNKRADLISAYYDFSALQGP